MCTLCLSLGEACLAAGCVQLSVSQIKCFKHVESRGVKKRRSSAHPVHYNVNWCLMCTEGGSLICCERCPSSFHTHCLGLDKEPDGSYLCDECTSGKTILHGDIIWCKIGNYRYFTCVSSLSCNLTGLGFVGGGLAGFIRWTSFPSSTKSILLKLASFSFISTAVITVHLSIAVKSFITKTE